MHLEKDMLLQTVLSFYLTLDDSMCSSWCSVDAHDFIWSRITQYRRGRRQRPWDCTLLIAETFLLLSQLSPPPSPPHTFCCRPAAHGLPRLPKLFLLAGPPHRSNAQTRFLSPRGASSDAAFQQTKLAFSESSPHRAQPQEHQRGRAPRWTCVLHSCQTFMVGKEPDT